MLTSEARAPGSPRGLPFRIDHYLFIATALLGVVVIAFLKGGLLPFRADTAGIVVPIVLMLGYVGIVTLIPRAKLRLDQVGDNLYYLGFTYTLSALAITLFRFHAEQGSPEYIVSNFGIALYTTILGVVLRIWLHQMREDPLELEREARVELTEAVGRLRSEIDQAVREFAHFYRTLQQIAKESIEAQGQVALEALDKSTKQYAEVTLHALGYIEKAFSDFQTHANTLASNSIAIATALSHLTERIDAIEAPRDMVEAKLAPAFERLAEVAEQTVGRVSAERQRNQNVLKLVQKLDEIAGSMDSIGEKVTDREARVSAAIQQSVAAADRTAKFAAQIEQWTHQFTEVERRQEAILADLARVAELAKDREQQRDGSLQKTLDDIARALTEYQTRSRSLLETHSEVFESELKRAETAFQGLRETLSQGADLLAAELAPRGY